MNIDMFELDSIMDDDNNARTGSLIPVLQDNSVENHYLLKESLEYVTLDQPPEECTSSEKTAIPTPDW